MIQLPEIFIQQMRELLPSDEFLAFCQTYNEPTVRGLRLNRLKAVPPSLLCARQNSTGDCESPVEKFVNLPAVSWCVDGRVYPEWERPAKSIFHHAGLFYIQEPSAMCPVEVLAPQPGDRVLDLCAAPGGKSAQIAGYLVDMPRSVDGSVSPRTSQPTGLRFVDDATARPAGLQGRGLLLSNDASPTRSRALVKNLERMGVTNAVVTTELPKKLADRFPAFFDKILVDAPCSGEGMFRRDTDAVKAYTANKPEACVAMQTEILRYAARMLAPGGRLVYSTCTFNTMENEGVIADFLENHAGFALVDINHEALGINSGISLPQTGRIFPHLAEGEGHFIALIERVGDHSPISNTPLKTTTGHNPDNSKPYIPKEFAQFCKEYITITDFPITQIVSHGANLYLQPEPLDLRGLRVARSGWFLGECAKGRFIPSHALAMGLRKKDVSYAVELTEENATRYLRGESLDAKGMFETEPQGKPWIMVCYQNLPLGWAKLVQGRLKNNLPVGLVIK